MTGQDRIDPSAVLCLDVGSTWTKAVLVSATGELLGTSAHVTTPPEVLDGVGAVVDRLGAVGLATLACSSAGGGLRLAVVGQEPLVSAEAGHRVALSAGARVVHVHAGPLGGADVRALRGARPDVV
ncbi:MAG TPA: glutamate mutase L, partial [Pseudonocardiaceae bacterium]